MPRERTARLPGLGASVRRPDSPPPQASRALRARLAAVTLSLVSIALLTTYFRESSDGALHTAQRIGLSVLTPFEIAGERVARPFRDAAGWTSDLFGAKAENERLRGQLEALRRQTLLNGTAARDNEDLRELLGFIDGPRFPDGFSAVATRVVVRPTSPYSQRIVIAAGSGDGVARDDPVVNELGLVGVVTQVAGNAAEVRLLTDPASAVSAAVLESEAAGIVQQSPSSGLALDRVSKEEVVEPGDTVITAGSKSGPFESVYPYGIAIGTVTEVGQNDVDLFKRIQVAPLVDFDSLSKVIVLVEQDR